MSKTNILIFICVNLLFCLSSCFDDDYNEFTEEPYLVCQINTPNQYHSMYGLGRIDKISPESSITNTFRLPLDMNNNTVVYIFEQNSIPTDTLTVSYEVELQPYGSTGCSSPDSFTVSVYSSKIVESQTTFNPDEIFLHLPL